MTDDARTLWTKGLVRAVLVLALLTTLVVACGAPEESHRLTATLDGTAKGSDGPLLAQDPDGSGTATIRLNPDKQAESVVGPMGEVCWELTVAGIMPAFAAHIHKRYGAQVVTLSPPASGSASGCTLVPRRDAKAILAAPEEYFVIVHNDEFPASALSGRLAE